MRKIKEKKYWELETPIEVITDHMEFRNFPEAGKFQMYGRFDVDGEMRRTKAIVLDSAEVTVSEATNIVKAIMEGLFDVSISDSVMNTIIDTVTSQPARDDEEDEDMDPVELELRKFEAGEIEAYAGLSQAALIRMCRTAGIKVSKRDGKAYLISKLEENDAGNDEEISEEELAQVLDEEFEDEVPEAADYSKLSFKDLKAECDKRGIGYKKIGESKANLINLLETYDDEHDDTSVLADETPSLADVRAECKAHVKDHYSKLSRDELWAECKKRSGPDVPKMKKLDLLALLEQVEYEEACSKLESKKQKSVKAEADRTSDDDDGNYDGKWLSFVGGEVVAAPQRRKADKAEAQEWLEYFQENVGEVEAIIKKASRFKTRSAAIVKLKKLLGEWVVAFEADDDTTSMLSDFVDHFCKDAEGDAPIQLVLERKRELCMIIDQM